MYRIFSEKLLGIVDVFRPPKGKKRAAPSAQAVPNEEPVPAQTPVCASGDGCSNKKDQGQTLKFTRHSENLYPIFIPQDRSRTLIT